jgi:hypothetical protein
VGRCDELNGKDLIVLNSVFHDFELWMLSSHHLVGKMAEQIEKAEYGFVSLTKPYLLGRISPVLQDIIQIICNCQIVSIRLQFN